MLLQMGPNLLRLGPKGITDGTFIRLGSIYDTCAFYIVAVVVVGLVALVSYGSHGSLGSRSSPRSRGSPGKGMSSSKVLSEFKHDVKRHQNLVTCIKQTCQDK